ncbi:hypothetical protein FKW77_006456 [Venturia effusa]|uniref:Uncharacterized protein n=1 Tax=Venturia effusa TaxID=50376 RepID=A0A517L1H0_9PEZI|nr:hypothetical protein FKW77_006456 [Venturia effusa]
MSQLQRYTYPGIGVWAEENLSYTQAIRVGNTIICSGQGGWDPNQDIRQGIHLHEDLEKEINQAFANCDLNLKNAGGKGWSQVYRVTTYSTDVKSQSEIIIANLRKWMPEHKATWTQLGVKELGLDTMHFEIDVEAYDEEGAEEARKAKAT